MINYIKPNKEKIALLIIDTQNDFTLFNAPAQIPGTLEIIPKLEKIVQEFRKKSKVIIHIVRIYLPDGSNVDLCRKNEIIQGKKIVIAGSNGAEIVDELKPQKNIKLDTEELISGQFQEISKHEWIMYKPRWGAFYNTHLDAFFKSKGIDTLVICGCNYPNCPRTSIYEASERDYKLILINDAISGIYTKDLQEMVNIGVNLMTTSDLLSWLNYDK